MKRNILSIIIPISLSFLCMVGCENNPIAQMISSPILYVEVGSKQVVSGGRVTLGNILTSTRKEYTVTLSNEGNVTLRFSSTPKVQFEGEKAGFFSISSDLPNQLATGESISRNIVCLTDTSAGDFEVTLKINSNDENNPVYSIVLSGTVVPPSVDQDRNAPIPDGEGIAISTITDSSVLLSWGKASDDATPEARLQYKVFYSLTDNIDSAGNAEANGTAVGTWTEDVTTKTVQDLDPVTTYFFSVIVKDEAGNASIIGMASATTPAPDVDSTPPAPGNNGIIDVTPVTATTINLEWVKADDNETVQTLLEYRVFKAENNNIATYTNAVANGDPLTDWSADITAKSVTDLASGTEYFFNVFVRDQEGNIGTYNVTRSVPDVEPPVPGGGGSVEVTGSSETTIDLHWTAATDTVTQGGQLDYRVFRSDTDNLGSYDDAILNGTPVGDWEAGITSRTVSGLTAVTEYYCAVFVRDGAGNIAAYDGISTVTSDETAPDPGNNGLLEQLDVTHSMIEIGWEAASDAGTDQEAIAYLLYYSTAGVMDTLSEVETNGTPVGTFTEGIVRRAVTGLDPTTSYFFNVVVRDSTGNKTVYQALEVVTTAVPADGVQPTAGDGGALATGELTETGFRLTWQAAGDIATKSSELQYRIYLSMNNSIDTFTGAEIYGVLAKDWTADITSALITECAPGKTYYVNVFVRDQAGNIGAYTPVSVSTPDWSPPIPGNNGIISVDEVTENTIGISWQQANDLVTAQSQLKYLVYWATSDVLGSYADAQTNGTAVGDWTAALTGREITGLEPAVHYYVTVFVRDNAGNIDGYESQSVVTPDNTPPIVGDSGAISIGSIGTTSVGLSWTAAVDGNSVTVPESLRYRVVASQTDTLSTPEDAIANDILQLTWTTGMTGAAVTGLSEGATYYFNIVVQDQAGNKTIYSVTDAVTTLEVAGLTIVFSEPGDEDITLNQTQDRIVSLSGSLNIEVDETFSSYVWYVDGEQRVDADNQSSMSIDCSVLAFGPHWVTVTVEKQGMWYSKTLRFRIEN